MSRKLIGRQPARFALWIVALVLSASLRPIMAQDAGLDLTQTAEYDIGLKCPHRFAKRGCITQAARAFRRGNVNWQRCPGTCILGCESICHREYLDLGTEPMHGLHQPSDAVVQATRISGNSIN